MMIVLMGTRGGILGILLLVVVPAVVADLNLRIILGLCPELRLGTLLLTPSTTYRRVRCTVVVLGDSLSSTTTTIATTHASVTHRAVCFITIVYLYGLRGDLLQRGVPWELQHQLDGLASGTV